MTGCSNPAGGGMGSFSHDNRDDWNGRRSLDGWGGEKPVWKCVVPGSTYPSESPLHRTINFCFHPITPPEFRL